MTLLNNFLASLPFMNAERANEAISAFWPMLEAAIDKTIPLAIISFFAGLVIALGVAVIRTMPKSSIGLLVLQLLCRIYVSIIRGTPMLVQIFIIFYGLPEVGIKLDPFPTAIIAFSINIGAYASETIRAAILSIPKGQWEASYSIGMNYFQTFTHHAASFARLRAAVIQHLHQQCKRHVVSFFGAGDRNVPRGTKHHGGKL